MVLDVLVERGEPIAFARTQVRPRLVEPGTRGSARRWAPPGSPPRSSWSSCCTPPGGEAIQHSISVFAPGSVDLHVIRAMARAARTPARGLTRRGRRRTRHRRSPLLGFRRLPRRDPHQALTLATVLLVSQLTGLAAVAILVAVGGFETPAFDELSRRSARGLPAGRDRRALPGAGDRDDERDLADLGQRRRGAAADRRASPPASGPRAPVSPGWRRPSPESSLATRAPRAPAVRSSREALLLSAVAATRLRRLLRRHGRRRRGRRPLLGAAGVARGRRRRARSSSCWRCAPARRLSRPTSPPSP